MFKSNTISIIISVLALFLSAFALVKLQSTPKVAYVIIQDVFDGFELKKEMEKEYIKVRDARKKILDSLQIDISVLAKHPNALKEGSEEARLFETRKMLFNQKLQEFEESNRQLTKDTDTKIVTQLNQYLEDYGKANNYDMIYGNTSGGSLMYGKQERNITKQVIEFINQKYKGIK